MSIDELERRFHANPDDEDLRAQLIVALRRSQRDQEAQQLIKERFSCPVSWDELETNSEDQMSRHCRQCDKAVYYVSSLSDLQERAEKQECVVAPPELVDQYCQGLAQSSLPLHKDSKELPHCMNSYAGDLTPLASPRFKGSVAPPPHIQAQIAAQRAEERRQEGLLGWIRRNFLRE